MVKRVRPEHYGRNPRHLDWERQGWPGQVQTLAQRVLPRASRLFGIANDLSWTTSEVVRSVARVEEGYEPERRTPAEIQANFNKQFERIQEELQRQRIPYEVVDPSHFHTRSKRFKRRKNVRMGQNGNTNHFILGFQSISVRNYQGTTPNLMKRIDILRF